ncbi:MAG: hypothetical protein ABIW76_10295 [Fibrobacteria bacterium]
MKPIDRRDFLFGAFHASPQAAPAGPVDIGRISHYPLGEERLAGSGTVMVESHPEGLRARSYRPGLAGGIADQYFAIRSDPSGGLIVDRSETWPADRVYSILTGEPARLNTHLEEKA